MTLRSWFSLENDLVAGPWLQLALSLKFEVQQTDTDIDTDTAAHKALAVRKECRQDGSAPTRQLAM